MKDHSGHSLAVFEVLPLDRLGFSSTEIVLENIVETLNKVGYGRIEAPGWKRGIILEIKDKDRVERLVGCDRSIPKPYAACCSC
jgi:hypothetical protein